MKNTALLIVDVQNGIATDSAYRKNLMIQSIKLLLNKFRQSGTDIILRIETEKESRDIVIHGGKNPARVRLGISGKLFRTSFIACGDGVRIASPRLSFEILER